MEYGELFDLTPDQLFLFPIEILLSVVFFIILIVVLLVNSED